MVRSGGQPRRLCGAVALVFMACGWAGCRQAECEAGALVVDGLCVDGGGGVSGDGGTAGSGGVDRRWGEATLIESDDAGDAFSADVAMHPDENTIAVWQQSDGTRFNIWANRYVPGTGWGTATLIETDNAGDAGSARVAMDPNGNAIAVWRQSNGMRDNVWANRYVPETGWGAATLIETDNAGDADDPGIAMDPDGNAIAIWAQSDGTRFNISANRYERGVGWGTAALIETDNAGNADGADVAMDADGNAIAVWCQSDGTRDNAWANRYIAGTGWGAPTLLENGAGNASGVSVAMNASGKAFAIWAQSDGTQFNLWANRYEPETDWGTGTLIENAGGDVFQSALAINGNGDALAVWTKADPEQSVNVWASRFVPATGWDLARVIENEERTAALPDVAMNADGQAIATWDQSDGMRRNILANRFEPAAGWSTPTLIETDNAGNAANARVAMDQSGRAIAVWHQFDGMRLNLWANRLE